MSAELSSRLKIIAGLVSGNARVADIGTDHGYLAVYLAENKIAQRVIACDINEKPLKNAEKAVALSEAREKIELRLCDGLSGINPSEIDTAIIAGMGAEVIIGILSRASWIKNDKYTLILQPMTSPELLREYLHKNGFEIISETALEDSNRLYSVIQASFTGEVPKINAEYYYIGKLNPSRAADRKYIKKQHLRFKKCAQALKFSGKTELYEQNNAIAAAIGKFIGE